MAAYITVGATTTHGGKVISGSPHTTHNGIPISRKGDKVICKKCKKVTTILTGDASFIVNGAPIARAGDVTSCGAKLIAVQQSFCESDFEVMGVEQPAPMQFPKSDPESLFASLAASDDKDSEDEMSDEELDSWRENAVADGLENGLVANADGGILPSFGPSNQDISDFSGISKDKIDAVGNTAAGFNQMWTFGLSDVLLGAPDPNKASTKVGQVAGMAAGTLTGSTAANSAIKVGQATKAAQAQRAAAIEKAAQRIAKNKQNRADNYLKFSPNWSKGSLKDSHEKFTPNAKGVLSKDGVKTRYTSSDSRYTITKDNEHNYYKIYDKTRRQNILPDGKPPSTRGLKGKEAKDAMQQQIHIRNTD